MLIVSYAWPVTTGDELRDARMRAGMTQQEVADALGVSLRSVGAWERSEVPPRQLARVNALLKPAEAPAQPLAAFDDLALIGELARRLAEHRNRATQAGAGETDPPPPDQPGLRHGVRRPRPDGNNTER